MSIKNVTDDSFSADVIESEKPVLVDFWAEWCGPCKQLSPKLDEISTELGDELVIAKVNIEENPTTPGQYGIRSIPTMLLFQSGELLATKAGGQHSKSDLLKWINETVEGAAA